jgi:hypothetical protein
MTPCSFLVGNAGTVADDTYSTGRRGNSASGEIFRSRAPKTEFLWEQGRTAISKMKSRNHIPLAKSAGVIARRIDD